MDLISAEDARRISEKALAERLAPLQNIANLIVANTIAPQIKSAATSGLSTVKIKILLEGYLPNPRDNVWTLRDMVSKYLENYGYNCDWYGAVEVEISWV